MALAAQHSHPLPTHGAAMVWVTRPQLKADEHAASLSRAGMHGIVSPVLKIVACPRPQLNAVLPDIILASSVNSLVHLPAAWCEVLRNIPIITSGSTTGSYAAELGFSDVRNSVGGGSHGMAELVLSVADKQPELKTLLYLAGKVRKPFLEETLKDAFDITVAELYEAQAIKDASVDLTTALHEGRVAAVTLFSSRSAALAAGLQRALGPAGLRNLALLDVVCISRAVANAAKEAGFDKIYVADAETESSVTQKLVEQLNIKNK